MVFSFMPSQQPMASSNLLLTYFYFLRHSHIILIISFTLSLLLVSYIFIRHISYPNNTESECSSAKKRGKKERMKKKWIGAEGETIHPNPGNVYGYGEREEVNKKWTRKEFEKENKEETLFFLTEHCWRKYFYSN